MITPYDEPAIPLAECLLMAFVGFMAVVVTAMGAFLATLWFVAGDAMGSALASEVATLFVVLKRVL